MSTESDMDNPERPAEREHREWTPLYRGLWAERLTDGDELPVGGSMFSDKLTSRLKLDFATFEDQLKNFEEGNLRNLFSEHRNELEGWMEKAGAKGKIDPFIFFVCVNLQNKLKDLLEITTEDVDEFGRMRMYGKDTTPALSELRGKTMCAERAAMAQHLLQRAGLKSAYVGGAEMADAKDREEYPSPHSYLVLEDPADPASTYVYDVARPRSQHNLPRILKTDVPLTPELLAGKEELFVRAKEVLHGGTIWFGVGAPVAGKHDFIENERS